MLNRVEVLIHELDDSLGSALCRSRLVQEKKRKLFTYTASGDGSMDWATIKKRRLNVFGGSGPGLSEQRVGHVCEAFKCVQAAEVDDQVKAQNVMAVLLRFLASHLAQLLATCLRAVALEIFCC